MKLSITKRSASAAALITAGMVIAAGSGSTTAGSAATEPKPGEWYLNGKGSAKVKVVPRGEITIAIPAEPQTLDQTTGSITEIAVASMFYDGLLGRTIDGKLRPNLATSYSLSANKLTWTFRLRQDVRFHNGDQFNAEAVKFSFERVMAPTYRNIARGYWTLVSRVEVLGPYTVAFHLSSPNPVLPAAFPWNLPIQSPRHAASVGDAGLATQPLGSGPFKLVRWDRGQQIVLEANNNYWGPKPAFKKVTIKFIADPAARTAALLSGSVDAAQSVPIPDITRIKRNDNLRVIVGPGLMRDRLALREDIAPFNDVRVRRAVAMAIDRKAIVKAILRNNAIVLKGPYVPGLEPYIDFKRLNDIPYNPVMAKALMAQAGLGGGVKVTFNVPNNTNPMQTDTAQAIAQYLSKIGITAEIVVDTQAVFQQKSANKSIGQMAMSLWLGGGVFHPYQTNDLLFNCKTASAVWNPGYFCHDRVAKLGRDAFISLVNNKPANATSSYTKAAQAAIDEADNLFLWSYLQNWGVKKSLRWHVWPNSDLVLQANGWAR